MLIFLLLLFDIATTGLNCSCILFVKVKCRTKANYNMYNLLGGQGGEFIFLNQCIVYTLMVYFKVKIAYEIGKLRGKGHWTLKVS